ncbi:hypothetical protein K466DRAFT_72529 [Polyporus arcularius HHB13444]|uniref:Uncharacterized protein n=1 Tax=Polyporus arcularius HHB13444 TaxID=1314778 RepID=A0A5C3PW64_9APHY|nr:hypothetical protein K466DRAFT_72529 [Polyporus arcularius HHB13444]
MYKSIGTDVLGMHVAVAWPLGRRTSTWDTDSRYDMDTPTLAAQDTSEASRPHLTRYRAIRDVIPHLPSARSTPDAVIIPRRMHVVRSPIRLVHRACTIYKFLEIFWRSKFECRSSLTHSRWSTISSDGDPDSVCGSAEWTFSTAARRRGAPAFLVLGCQWDGEHTHHPLIQGGELLHATGRRSVVGTWDSNLADGCKGW